MTDYCVVVAEGARARFFTLEPAEIPELESGPNLVERGALANPAHLAHQDSSLWTETRGGRNRNANGPGHGYDEHRQNHDDELEHRFARDIAGELAGMLRRNGSCRVVLCAEKRMLGFLRTALSGTSMGGSEVVEVAKDLAKESPREIHERLARDGHLPARRARGAAG